MKLRTVLTSLLLIVCITIPTGVRGSGSAVQDFLAKEGNAWRFHWFDDGRLRSIYGSGSVRLIPDAESAKAFFRDYASLFGIKDVEQLRLTEIETEASGDSYHFQQRVLGIPVIGGQFSVHTDQNRRIIAASGQYHKMDRLQAGAVRDSVEARATARRFRFADAGVSEGTLMILASMKDPRFVWKFSAVSSKWPGQWAVYVDALMPEKILRVHREFAEETATGSVYRENSVVTPNRTSEKFPALTDAGQLSGKYTRTYNGNFLHWFGGGDDLTPFTTAAEADEDYTFPDTDSKFSEAMAYYHINVVHDRWRSFGFRKLQRQFPVFVNIVTSTGVGFDNAFYTRGFAGPVRNGAIVMGAGDFFENFGHDGDVYYHEYGHAVLDRAKPGFFSTIETNYPNAFHEAFSDISASGITGNSKLAELALRSRSNGRFFGRDLENNNRYPQNVIDKRLGRSQAHYTGLIIGGTWWDLQKVIGLDDAQRILYKSLSILPDEMTFFDLRDAMLAADQRASGGANASAIQNAFAEHGITGEDPGQQGTVEIRSLKTARYNFDNGRLRLRKSFKQGEYIIVLAGYKGTGLTPGYNLIPIEMEVNGPAGSSLIAYPSIGEVSNGLHLRKKGAWVAEIDTSGAPSGDYSVTILCRLGGTSTLTDVKTVHFRITQ